MADTPSTAEAATSAAVEAIRTRIREGGRPERRAELQARGNWLVRDRLKYLLDPGFEIEDWILARCEDPSLPADAVVTTVGAINGRRVCVMASDMSVKAGTWGVKTVLKIQRIQEVALEYRMPIVYLVDSGGARIDEQYGLYLDRSHSGRIFWNMARMNGVVPQVCINFGPSPAGAAYLPAFCDLVVMIDGRTSVFLGSPRQAAAATGEKVTAEEMGGARMHCAVSGLGDVLVASEAEALDAAKRYLSYLPDSWQDEPADVAAVAPASDRDPDAIIPANERRAFNMRALIDALIDGGSFFEMKKEYAGELITGFARIGGVAVGIMADQPMVRGGILMQDSSEKGAQFVSTCSAFNVPMVFLMDVPGFMISSQCERAAIVRRGQKLLQAVAEATQTRICVIVRKGYGAGYMALSGATFQPDCTIALPQAKLGLMGPGAAIQAIYGRKIEDMAADEKGQFVAQKQEEYSKGLGVWGPASEMYIDDIVPGRELRQQLIMRLEIYRRRHRNRQPLAVRHNHIMRG
ncbi:MAG TPA: carboxyl transferase domain-containing protein [Nevskiaceae bacterium]|nr:carboxyl transferase domain-containing protein [Nevskiaceae bacterium]